MSRELHLCQIVNEEVDLSEDRLKTLVDHPEYSRTTVDNAAKLNLETEIMTYKLNETDNNQP